MKKIDNSIEAKKFNVKASQKKASAKYEKSLDQLTVRVPKGIKEKLKEYVKASESYSSVNDLIKSLLEQETGLEF